MFTSIFICFSALDLRSELHATRCICELRVEERPPFMWYIVNAVGSSLPNKPPRTISNIVEGMVGFTWQVLSLKLSQESADRSETWHVWPTS